MTPSPLFKPILQRGKYDCGVAVLAAFLNHTYEEVLVEACRVSPSVLKTGLYSTQMIEVAAALGHTLKRRRRNIDLDESAGILELRKRTLDKNGQPLEHVVLLTNGLVFDPQEEGNVWDADIYVKVEKAKVLGLLEER